MSAEQTPDIETRMFAAEAVRDVLTEATRLSLGDRNRVAWQVVDALAPVLAAAVREAKGAAWDEGERHESEYLATWGQFCPGRECNPYRADRVAEPQHEAATSGKESEARDE